jgi:hypothetical protein
MSGMTLLTIGVSLVALAALWAFWRGRRLERARSEARVAALAAVLDPPSEDDRAWLAAPDVRAPVHPLLTIALGFAVVALTIIAAVTAAGMRPRPAVGPGPSAREPQLVLMALRYERDGQHLVVKGLVQNHGTAPPTGVTAVVMAFGREGRLLARNGGPLRLQGLEPGAQADFAVTVEGAAEAARYQVTFRGPEGIIRHVDLRGRAGARPAGGVTAPAPVASRQAETVTP